MGTGFDWLAQAGAQNAQRQAQQRQDLAQTQRQQAIQQSQAASLKHAHALLTGIDPDTGAPLTPEDKVQYAQRYKELQAHQQDLWNPRQDVNQMGPNLAAASGVAMPETPLHKVGDFLHITQPPAPGTPQTDATGAVVGPPKSPQQQMQDLRDITQKYQPLPGQQDAEAASFALKSHLRDIDNMPDLTDEQKQEASAHALGLPFSGSFKPPVTLTLADGTTMSAQQSAKDGRWYDLNRQLIPSESLAGAKAQGKDTSDTRLRADFAADQNKLPGETFPDWKHRKNSAPGYTFIPKTGMVTEKATGKQYSPGDPNNPPEVAAVFKGAADMTAHTEAFQTRLAAIKAASYGQARQMAPLQVLDSANGNAPMYSTYLEMMKQPGRYIPANEGDKAIAKENLMQDIQGSSKIFRSDIAKMKADFPVDMQAKIALAMRADDPHAALSQVIGADALGSLSPDQQQVYVDLQQLAEQGMAVRSLLGAGQGSDTMRAAMRTTLPSLLGPKDLAIRQLNAFDATIARLHRGVNNVKLNETGQPPATGGSGSGSFPVTLPNGKGTKYFPNKLAADRFKQAAGIQ